MQLCSMATKLHRDGFPGRRLSPSAQLQAQQATSWRERRRGLAACSAADRYLRSALHTRRWPASKLPAHARSGRGAAMETDRMRLS